MRLLERLQEVLCLRLEVALKLFGDGHQPVDGLVDGVGVPGFVGGQNTQTPQALVGRFDGQTGDDGLLGGPPPALHESAAAQLVGGIDDLGDELLLERLGPGVATPALGGVEGAAAHQTEGLFEVLG